MRITITALAIFASTGLSFAQLGFQDTFQLNYLNNILLGGSITMTQANFHGSSVPGVFICASLYVFAPDESMVSCCSCPIVGRGLVSLSVASLLAGIPVAPTSVSIRMIAAIPSGLTCTATTTPSAFAQGLRAWATRAATATSFTESQFVGSPLSMPELTGLAALCTSTAGTCGTPICAH